MKAMTFYCIVVFPVDNSWMQKWRIVDKFFLSFAKNFVSLHFQNKVQAERLLMNTIMFYQFCRSYLKKSIINHINVCQIIAISSNTKQNHHK